MARQQYGKMTSVSGCAGGPPPPISAARRGHLTPPPSRGCLPPPILPSREVSTIARGAPPLTPLGAKTAAGRHVVVTAAADGII